MVSCHLALALRPAQGVTANKLPQNPVVHGMLRCLAHLAISTLRAGSVEEVAYERACFNAGELLCDASSGLMDALSAARADSAAAQSSQIGDSQPIRQQDNLQVGSTTVVPVAQLGGGPVAAVSV